MADTTCPHCLTQIIKSDDPGEWSRESDAQWHDVYRCRDVLHAQLTAERAKVEEAIGIAWDLAIYADDSWEHKDARAALEKLRGQ